MFKEVAIEPAAVATSYRDFSYIIEKFGIPEGRLIAAFPSKWKRFVYQAAQRHLHGKAELSKLEVRLRALSEDTFYARGRPGEGCSVDWLEAAVAENKRDPFDAIIASTKLDDPEVISAADLDGDHPCLKPNRQWDIEREADVMARCCAPLLSKGKHIKLVDPHFDLGHKRFLRPFLEFLKHVRIGARVDIYRGDGQEQNYIAHRIQQAIHGVLPAGVVLRLFLLPEGPMHNRFVLTEAGGLYFLTGLDDKGQGEKVTDQVGLLDPEVWALQWERHSSDHPVASWS